MVCSPSAPTARLCPHPRVAQTRSSAMKAAYLVENSWAECPQCRVFLRVLPSLPGPPSFRHKAGWARPACAGHERPTRCFEKGGLAVSPVGIGPAQAPWCACVAGSFHWQVCSGTHSGDKLQTGWRPVSHGEPGALAAAALPSSSQVSAPCALALTLCFLADSRVPTLTLMRVAESRLPGGAGRWL